MTSEKVIEVWYTIEIQGVTKVRDTDNEDDMVDQLQDQVPSAFFYPPDQITVNEWGRRETDGG